MTTANRLPLFVIGLLILLPTGAQAQRISTVVDHADPVPQTLWVGTRHNYLLESSAGGAPANRLPGIASGPRSGATLAFGGLVGGALGFFAGGLSGVAVCGCSSGGEAYQGLEAFLWGAAVGTVVAIPLGVHMANRFQGSYGTALAASVVIAAIGLAAAIGANDDTGSPAIVFMIPVSQIVSSVLIERRTTR